MPPPPVDDEAQLAPRFAPLLEGLDLEALARVPDITCGVFSDDLTIGYVNTAWLRFARANGASRAWALGDHLLDAMSEPLRAYYAERLAHVLSERAPWEHDYECSSPEVHRTYRLRVVEIGNGGGLLLTHSLRVERPHGDVGEAGAVALYLAETGLFRVCAHCRRAHRAAPPYTWDWVPELLSRRNVTHTICPLCLAYYFGPSENER